MKTTSTELTIKLPSKNKNGLLKYKYKTSDDIGVNAPKCNKILTRKNLLITLLFAVDIVNSVPFSILDLFN